MSLPDHPKLRPLTSASRLSSSAIELAGVLNAYLPQTFPSALHVVCVIALCVAGFRSVGVHLHGRLIGEGAGIEILEIVA